jgi:hypothetical protein
VRLKRSLYSLTVGISSLMLTACFADSSAVCTALEILDLPCASGDTLTLTVPQIAGQLAGSNLIRSNSVHPPTSIELGLISQFENFNLQGLQFTPDWNTWVDNLKSDAGISPSVQIEVTYDLRTSAVLGTVAGGDTQHNFVILDGKFLEISSDYSTWISTQEAQKRVPSEAERTAAIDSIVIAHMSMIQPVPPLYGNPGNLPPDILSKWTDHFKSMAGAIMYHEYGHYWGWALLSGTIRKHQQVSALALHPSGYEDQADLISGMLSKKAGHNPNDGMLMFDLMTYYGLYKLGLAQSFSQVTNSTVLQYTSLNAAYSPISARKNTFGIGYTSFGASTSAVLSESQLATSTSKTHYNDAMDQRDNYSVRQTLQQDGAVGICEVYRVRDYIDAYTDSTYAIVVKFDSEERTYEDMLATIRAVFREASPNVEVREEQAYQQKGALVFVYTYADR